jgi:hypothetical protein
MYDPHLLNPNNKKDSEVDWQTDFGFLANEGKPVLLGAFNASTSNPPGSTTPSPWCQNDPSLDLPQTFLNFLAEEKIGVIGWAFDHPDSIVTDYTGTPTTYVGMQCGSTSGGSGVLLQKQFALPDYTY